MSRRNRTRWAGVALTAAAAATVAIAAWAAPSTQPVAGPTTAPASRPAERTDYRDGRRDRRSRRDGRDGREGRTTPTPVDLGPTSAPSTTPKPMASAYSAVKYRSIFVRGNQSIGDRGGSGSRPVRTYDPPPVVRPETTLVFKGVTLVDNRADALVEDTANNRVLTVQIGGAIASGKVSSITFDSLDYVAAGKVTHVGVGQTLDGVDAAPGSDAAPNGAPTTGPAGGPAADPAGGIGSTSGLSADDILARLKRRRQQQMGGK